MTLKKFFGARTIASAIIIVVAGLVAAFNCFNSYIYEQKQAYAGKDHKNAEYLIEGVRVRLKDGVAETESVSSSSSKVVTTYFGNELRSDLDGDGREDVVFLVTQNSGGSGTFYYAVGALNTERGYIGSDGVLLGDRIAPQTTEKGNYKIVIVNYADRAFGEPFTTPPHIGKTLWLLLDPVTMQFGLVEPNFSGESADGPR